MLQFDDSCYIDAKQHHLASFSTCNSTLNTWLHTPIRMQDFIQLCDSTEKPFPISEIITMHGQGNIHSNTLLIKLLRKTPKCALKLYFEATKVSLVCVLVIETFSQHRTSQSIIYKFSVTSNFHTVPLKKAL